MGRRGRIMGTELQTYQRVNVSHTKWLIQRVSSSSQMPRAKLLRMLSVSTTRRARVRSRSEKWEEDIDQDGTGYVEYEEFETLVRRKIQEDEDERELKEIFRVLDKEKRGEVNTSELRWILKSLGDDLTEEDIDDMIADVDTDGSGWVDYDEFSKLMMG